MNLSDRLAAVVTAIGADIKSLRSRLTAVEGSTGSTVPVINAATRLIQTQRITAQIVLRGKL